MIYSFDTQKYEKITDVGGGGDVSWLQDSRRLITPEILGRKLYLVDVETKQIHEVLTAEPGAFISDPRMSRDGRTLYYVEHTAEADIWMATFQ